MSLFCTSLVVPIHRSLPSFEMLCLHDFLSNVLSATPHHFNHLSYIFYHPWNTYKYLWSDTKLLRRVHIGKHPNKTLFFGKVGWDQWYSWLDEKRYTCVKLCSFMVVEFKVLPSRMSLFSHLYILCWNISLYLIKTKVTSAKIWYCWGPSSVMREKALKKN